MNRQQRRQQERGKKIDEPVMVLKRSEAKQVVEEIVQQELKKIQNEALSQTIALMCLELNKRFGFGQKRLQEIAAGISNQFDCLQTGNITKKDLLDTLQQYKIHVGGAVCSELR